MKIVSSSGDPQITPREFLRKIGGLWCGIDLDPDRATDGEVEEVWSPRYNSLTLFMVPTMHVVSYVAPFAKQPRYAITGWLCDGPETMGSA